jgi:hypothetical protein
LTDEPPFRGLSAKGGFFVLDFSKASTVTFVGVWGLTRRIGLALGLLCWYYHRHGESDEKSASTKEKAWASVYRRR